MEKIINKPSWLKVRYSGNNNIKFVQDLIKSLSLHTVCQEANCPNIGECFSKRTATFMILGKYCTRNCTFCNVTKATPLKVDEMEPDNVAEAVKILNLEYVVITSVTRDDLEDGGASHFANVINKIRYNCPDVNIEVLIPDFKGNLDSLSKVVKANPNVINHNIETIPRLYKMVRPMASYKRSLEILKYVKIMDDNIITKSGIMLGLGEEKEEVIDALNDLNNVGCDLITIGQYLAPSEKHFPVKEYIKPEVFKDYEKLALEIGFKGVASGPFVRSSYNAKQMLKSVSF